MESTEVATGFTEVKRGGVPLLLDERAAERGVLVAFTSRRGGISVPPFDTLNLALSVGDERSAALANRRRAAHALGFDAGRLALARQVHGAEVLEARPGDAGVLGEGDGLLARSPGVVLAILTADCAPVLLAGRDGVAILHAGWRGLVAGAVEAGVAALGGAESAWVGPSIRACCYEVGAEVTGAFANAGLPVAGPRRVDPAAAAEAALQRAGVESVRVAPYCTGCSPDFFSHRRDGVTGRQGAFIGLLEDAS